jgi:hypothetical protein
MRATRAGALAAKGRAKAQRADALARNTLFIEVVKRWDADQTAGEGTKDLKRRHGSLAAQYTELEVRNTELDEECDSQ